jgi:hypothetical protein
MRDTDLRNLERRAVSGDVGARERLLNVTLPLALTGSTVARDTFMEHLRFEEAEDRLMGGELDGEDWDWYHPLVQVWTSGARQWGTDNPGTVIDCNPTYAGGPLSRHVLGFRRARERETDEMREQTLQWREERAREWELAEQMRAFRER